MEFGNDWKLGHLLDGLQSTNGISGASFRPTQYKELRKELAKVYEIEDVSTKRSPVPRPWMKFPYEIELEFRPAHEQAVLSDWRNF